MCCSARCFEFTHGQCSTNRKHEGSEKWFNPEIISKTDSPECRVGYSAADGNHAPDNHERPDDTTGHARKHTCQQGILEECVAEKREHGSLLRRMLAQHPVGVAVGDDINRALVGPLDHVLGQFP